MSTSLQFVTMLKFMNSSYRCIGVSADQLTSELPLNTLYLLPRKKFAANNALQRRKYQNANVCAFNQKSVIPEVVPRGNTGGVTCDPRWGLVPVKLDAAVDMGDPQRSECCHVGCSGVFEISPELTQYGLRPSMSNDATSYANPPVKRPTDQGTVIPADFRVWEPVNKRFGHHGDSFKFKLLSYNVLAQYLLEWHPYLYRRCATNCLKWDFRSMLLLEEIRKLSPDIVCLQEVQASHIPTFYKKLEEIGYTGVFKQKTGNRQDGCAIYFKESVFSMKDYISVEFYQPDLPILNRDNIGIMLKLTPRNMPNSPFIVATTHLLFNPKRTDVRLAQMQVFLAEIDRFSFSAKKGKGHLPTILTGDLNSLPESAVVHLLSSGNVRTTQYRDGSDWKKIGVTDNCQHLAVYLSRQKGEIQRVDPSKLMIYNSDYRESEEPIFHKDMEQNTELFNTGTLVQSLNLKSVYEHTKRDGQTEATTFQNEWVTVDYIYFSCQSGLNLLERLYLPTAQECRVLRALPNEEYGSDHLALGAIFELKSLNCSL